MSKLRQSILERASKGENLNDLLNLTIQTLSDRTIDSYQPKADFTTPDAEMLTRLVRDTWHFSAAKNYQEMRDLTLALKGDDGKVRNLSDYKDEADKIIDKYNVTWLETEYNLAISSSQSAARWVEFQREADIIPNLKYQTVGDDHVRATHKVLDGIIRPLKDIFWSTHYPPNGFNCRCEAVQELEGYGKVTPVKNIPVVDIPAMFKTNLANTGLIYPKNHPYYIGVPKSEISKALSYLPAENTFVNVDFGKGVSLDIHPLHGDKELKENIDISRLLKSYDKKAEIKLLPIIEDSYPDARKKYLPENYLKKFPTKNPDVLYNGKPVEYETASNSRSSVQNAIKEGKKQAEHIVIHISDDMQMSEAVRIAKGQLKHYQDKENLIVWLINKDERVQFITKQKQ